jgi:uncharacterized protein
MATHYDSTTPCTAFEGHRMIASGSLAEVAMAAWTALQDPDHGSVLLFDDATAHRIEVDFRGAIQEALGRLPMPPPREPEAARGPGRPKLGVVAREVTLLPRHWEWLNAQPGGASVALRKLVEEARRTNGDRDRIRQSREAAYRFMHALGGDLPGFEEASRALFAGDREGLEQRTAGWPQDVRGYLFRLAEECLAADEAAKAA